MQEKLYTIGHGNKAFDDLAGILKTHEIQTLVDIRSYPQSQRNPHFNRETLQAELPQAGIAYEWFRGLGGYRKKGLGAKSPHVALKSQGFRNYADHMLEETFKEDINRLFSLIHSGNTCLMCAETLPFRCHRWILSDYLAAHGVDVVHLIDIKKSSRHKLSEYARIEGGNVFYDRVASAQQQFVF